MEKFVANSCKKRKQLLAFDCLNLFLFFCYYIWNVFTTNDYFFLYYKNAFLFPKEI